MTTHNTKRVRKTQAETQPKKESKIMKNFITATEIIDAIQSEQKSMTSSWREIAKQFALAYDQFGSDSDAFKGILKATNFTYDKAMKLKDIGFKSHINDPIFDRVAAWTVLHAATKLDAKQMKTLKQQLRQSIKTDVPTLAMIKSILNPEVKTSDPYQKVFTIKVDRNAIKGDLLDADAFTKLQNLVAEIQNTVPYVRVDAVDVFDSETTKFFADVERTTKTICRERLNAALKSYRESKKNKKPLKKIDTENFKWFGEFSDREEMNASFNEDPFAVLDQVGASLDKSVVHTEAMLRVQTKREKFAKLATEQFKFANTISECASTDDPIELSEGAKKVLQRSKIKVAA